MRGGKKFRNLFILIAIFLLTFSSITCTAQPKSFSNTPKEVKTPDTIIKSYFDTLYYASNLNEEEMGYAGGTIGMSSDPYDDAYKYWSEEWRNKNSYEDFINSWKGTANVELIKSFPVSEKNGNYKFFVEIKTIEAVQEKKSFGIFYYCGYLTIENTKEGYKITKGNLELENMAWAYGGHQPWKADPEFVAKMVLEKNINDKIEKTEIEKTENGISIVKFMDTKGKIIAQVEITQRMDSLYEVLWKKI